MSERTVPTQPRRKNDHPMVSSEPRWKLWVVRVVVFCAVFAFLLTAFTAMGAIVERFFFALYTE